MLKILTLHWNKKESLEKLYPSLMKSLDKIEYQFLIKDNGSIDNSKDTIKSWNNPNVKLIECDHNRDSFSKGCNILFKESQAKDEDFVLLLNNDVVFNDTKSISNMMSLFNDSTVGMVGAKLKFTNTNKIQHAGVVFSKHNSMPYHFAANKEDGKKYSINREFQAITGAVCMMRAEDYNKINGLDEKYFFMFEDIDAALSVKYNLNKKVVCCGNTNIFHEESSSLKKNPLNKLFMNQNIYYFADKWKDKCVIDEDLYSNDKYNLYKRE